jgi:hypothetical protein
MSFSKCCEFFMSTLWDNSMSPCQVSRFFYHICYLFYFKNQLNLIVKYCTQKIDFLNKILELEYICEEVIRYIFCTILYQKMEVPTVQN